MKLPVHSLCSLQSTSKVPKLNQGGVIRTLAYASQPLIYLELKAHTGTMYNNIIL